MTMKQTVHICSFTSGLDELPRKQQASLWSVLHYLSETKRFSVFEATANNVIARTMDVLGERGYFKSTGGAYPWCEIEITEKGLEFLAEGK